MTPKTWQLKKTRTVADCKVFKVLGRTFRHPDGRQAEFYVNDSADWVQCVALVNDGGKLKAVLVNQFRFGVERTSWEFSGGIVERGEDPVVAARRELLEETGYAGGRARVLAAYSPNPAIQNNTAYVVLIENCKKVSGVNWDENEEIQTKLVDVEKLDALVSSGKIFHSIAINAVYFLQKALAKRAAAKSKRGAKNAACPE